MGTFHKTWAAVLIFVFSTMAASQDALDLVRRVSENYHNLRSFEFAGHLTATIPGTELLMHVDTVDAEAGRSFVPEHSPVLKYAEALSFRTVKITDALGKTPAPSGASVAMPGHWGYYERIIEGLTSVKELPSQVIDVGGAPVQCDVLEIVYDRERWKPEERTVKYWIDAKRLLVMKEEFAELQGRGDSSVQWRWFYTVDSVKLNQPPPEWLVDSSTKHGDQPRPERIGRDAPDFSLLDLDGRQVVLSTMRSKIVVLDFWATWCGPCIEEMPTVENIGDAYEAKGVEVWGISDETPSTVKQWMAHHKRKLQTVIDLGGKTFEQYHVEGIPALVVIGRDGKILSYYTGTQSEQSLRSAIDVALKESPAKNK